MAKRLGGGDAGTAQKQKASPVGVMAGRDVAKRKDEHRRMWMLAALGCLVILFTALSLMLPAISMTKGDLICGLEEHTHTEACYQEVLACGEEENADHEHTDACYVEELACGQEEHEHTDACYEQPQEDAQQDGGAAGQAAETSEPAQEGNGSADAPNTQEEPLSADEPQPEQAEQAIDAGTSMPAQQFYGELRNKKDVVTLAVDVDAPEGALPEGAAMEVKAVKAKDVTDAIQDALDAEDAGKVDTVQAVDITFKDASGYEVEPLLPVSVKLASPQIAEAVDDDRQPLVAHVDDDGKAELVDVLSDKQLAKRDIQREDDELLFDADAFSVYAIVYTVDFHYQVGSETYDFSIPGGGGVALSSLVRSLGVGNDGKDMGEAKAWEFVQNVQNVEFSSPELVAVVKASEDTTIGALRKSMNLDEEYFADISDEDIAKINSTTVRAGDWALLALQPFTSDELLKITLNDGSEILIGVTDLYAMLTKLEISGEGSVTLTEGRFTGTFPNWRLTESTNTYASSRNVWISANDLVRNNKMITASPASGYQFDHWEYGDRIINDAIIDASSLDIGWNKTLKAVFTKKTSGPGSGSTTPTTDFESLIDAWQKKMLDNQPVVSKTAQVKDYANRIYQIDLNASSGLHAVDKNLDIAFVTDTSASMKFPSGLQVTRSFSNASDFINKLNALFSGNTTPNGEYYYMITSPDKESTVWALRKYNEKWYYTDASLIESAGQVVPTNDPWRCLNDNALNNGSTVYLKNNGYTVEKNIYIATDTTQRLGYLKQALTIASDVVYDVNAGAQIGLVTFNNKASYINSYGSGQKAALQQAISNITTDGGTRQDEGLRVANEHEKLFKTSDPSKKQVVILITDGAPNGTDWPTIQTQANYLKGKDVTIYTVGLSVKNVNGAVEGLTETASINPNSVDQDGNQTNGSYFYSAEDGKGLVEAVESIIESVMTESMLVGDVQDTLSSEFYPVDADGNPIADGATYEGGTWTKNSDGTWTVKWMEQEISWPYYDNGDVEHPGWNKQIYAKAKEDFLGGNTIKTNAGKENGVTATGFKTDGGNSGKFKESVSKRFETPSVNVNELGFTENSSSETVVLGSDVTPSNAIKALFDDVSVKQVVKENGTTDGDTRISSADKAYYEKGGAEDKDYPDSGYASLPLKHFMSDAEYNNLIAQLTQELVGKQNNESVTKTVKYSYGNGELGELKVTLEKHLQTHNDSYIKDAPGTHKTDTVGTNVETYTLTVSYVPNDAKEDVDYKTTPGGERGKDSETSESENVHVVHVTTNGVPGKPSDLPDIEHHKKIDYLGDGVANTDTNATSDENVAMDLYRLYLDTTLKKSVSNANIILVEDFSTSMDVNKMTGINGGETSRYEVMRSALVGNDGFVNKVLNSGNNNQMTVIRFSDNRKHDLIGGGQVDGSSVLQGWTTDAAQVLDVVNQNYPSVYTSDDDWKYNYWRNPNANDNSCWTNYELALKLAGQQIDALSSDARKNPTYVVFLSDGLPTSYGDNTDTGGSNGKLGVIGNEVKDNISVVIPATEAAINNFRNKYDDVFISTIGFAGNMENFIGADKNPSFRYPEYGTQYQYKTVLEHLQNNGYWTASNGSELVTALQNAISRKDVSNVTITDTLSEYVDLFTNQPDFKVTKKAANGTETALTTTKNDDGTYTVTDGSKEIGTIQVNGKEVQLVFTPELAYEDGNTYTISFNVAASTKAYKEYADNLAAEKENPYGMYAGDEGTDFTPTVGDNDTDYVKTQNKTSSGKPGFYSNDPAKTSIYYTYDDQNYTYPYEKPVIQVGKTKLEVQKTWSGVPNDKVPESVTLKLFADGAETGKTITLEKSQGWTKTVDNLDPKKLVEQDGKLRYEAIRYTLVESPVPSGFQVAYEFTATEAVGKDAFENTTSRYEASTNTHVYYIPESDDTAAQDHGSATVKNTLNEGKIHVQKVWEDPSGNDVTKDSDKHPETITYNIYQLKHVHVYDDGTVTKQPTDTEPGVIEYRCKYKDCDATYTSVLGPNGCDWGDWETVKPATCEEEGEEQRVCNNNSNHVEKRPINALGHDWDNGVVTTPATCEVDGIKTFTCQRDANHTKIETIKATGHTWGEWKETTPATTTSEGVETRTCSKCSESETRPIDKLQSTVTVKYHIVNPWNETQYFNIDSYKANGEVEVPADGSIEVSFNVQYYGPEFKWRYGNSEKQSCDYRKSDDNVYYMKLLVSPIVEGNDLYIYIQKDSVDNGVVKDFRIIGVASDGTTLSNASNKSSKKAASAAKAKKLVSSDTLTLAKAPDAEADAPSSITTGYEKLDELISKVGYTDKEGNEHPYYSYVTYKENQTLSYPWTADINVPLADENGNEYIYFVVETDPSTGYITTYSGQDSGLHNGDKAIITNKEILKERDVQLVKVGKDNTDPTGTETKVGGAKFTIYHAKGENLDQRDGVVTVGEDAGARTLQDLESEEGTGLIWSGKLPVGTYIISEKQAPAGYYALAGDIKLTVAEDSISTKLLFTTGDQNGTCRVDNDSAIITIIDVSGKALPSTGGPGAGFIYLLAGLLVAASSLVLFLRRGRAAQVAPNGPERIPTRLIRR